MQISRARVERIMATKQLTHTAIAERMKVSSVRISQLLDKGRCQPATAGRLAKALRSEIEDILEIEDP